MGNVQKRLRELMLTACGAAILAVAPVTFSFDDGFGAALGVPKALAKGGSDDDRDDRDDDDDDRDDRRDRDDDRDDRDDDDDRDDRDDDDDRDDRDDDDDGRHGGDDDDDDDDDRRGRNRGGDGDRDGDNDRDSRRPKVEVTRTGIEVVYPNGTKEEIENGWYERKDANGRTVEERRATGRDFRRLSRVGRRVQGTADSRLDRSTVTKVEVSRGHIEINYASGWKEEIEAGRYELKDPNNNTVIERPATDADIARLRGLAGV